MGYAYRESSSRLINVIWRAEVDEGGEFTDAANEFWGLAFDRGTDGTVDALLVGPSLAPRTFTTCAGEVSWGVEFAASVFLRRVPKLSMMGELRSLPVDAGWFEIGGVRFPIPTYDDLDRLVVSMRQQGILSQDATIARVLSGQDPGYSARHLRRIAAEVTGLRPKQLQQLRRAREAYRLMTAGHRLADAALAAGFSDQAHMTRSLRLLSGQSPARILTHHTGAFASRPLEHE